jgi:zinc-ribbon domain
MFCPKCATQNLEGASFCRVCGANISLIPQAMAGPPAESGDEASDCVLPSRNRRNKRGELTLDNSFRNIFMGVAFLIVAIALSKSIGGGWWFWLLIPAFSMMGTGVAQFIRLKEREKQRSIGIPESRPSFSPRASAKPMPQRDTGELLPPPSVTEGTTRHLGSEGATRHLDATEQKQ